MPIIAALVGVTIWEVYSDTCVRMTEQFAESFWVETIFNADGSISVTKKMKVDTSDSAVFQNCFESVLYSSWFSWLAFTCDDIEIAAVSVAP